jgi:hypothetical protein
MRIRNGLTLVLVFATMGGAARASAPIGLASEEYNGFAPLPPSAMLPGGANAFTMVFAGNVASSINTSATQSDSSLNPFQFINSIIGSGTTSVTASFNGTNTVVTFTGSNPISSTSSFDFGNGLPHFGLGASDLPQALDILSQAWSNTTTSTTGAPLPSVSVTVTATLPAADPYAIVFVDATSNGSTVGQWFELPFTGTSPQATLTNSTSVSETLSNVGYYISPTLIPLDNLNFNDYPPPGTAGSPFTPLPSVDGTTLGSGGIVTFSLPEPSGMISMGTGLLVVAGYFGHRRLAARAG